MAFAKALKTMDVPEGGVAKTRVNERDIAIIHWQGKFYALDGICTHEGGPLGEGTIQEDELVCPWHEGRYKIMSGEADPETDWVTDIKSFSTKVEDGFVWVDV